MSAVDDLKFIGEALKAEHHIRALIAGNLLVTHDIMHPKHDEHDKLLTETNQMTRKALALFCKYK